MINTQMNNTQRYVILKRKRDMNEEGMFEIECMLVRKTKAAFLINDGDREVWIPLSLIHGTEEMFVGDEITIHIPECLAVEKELV